MTQPGNQWSIAQRLIQWHPGATQCVCPDPPLIPTDTHQSAYTPWLWSCGMVPWPSLDVTQPVLCALSWWHSCLVGKKNRAGKTNRAGSFSGSILLPLMFFLMCCTLYWGRKRRLKNNPWKSWMQDSACIWYEMGYDMRLGPWARNHFLQISAPPSEKKTELPIFCIELLQKKN